MLADVIDHAATDRLLDAIFGSSEVATVLYRHALDLGDMRWRRRPDDDVTAEDVEAVRRWLTAEWTDWLLLAGWAASTELRETATAVLLDVEVVDDLDLWRVARFVRALYRQTDKLARPDSL